MMIFHNEVIEEGTRTSANASEYAIERAIKYEMPINPSLKNSMKHRIKCKICHLQFTQLKSEVDHVKTVHNGLNLGYFGDPYKKLQIDNICAIGCGFQGKNKQELRQHLILMHSDFELTKWGMSRMYLKLQEGLIDLKDFKAAIAAKLKQGKEDPFDRASGNLI
jgi:hypothetical protein